MCSCNYIPFPLLHNPLSHKYFLVVVIRVQMFPPHHLRSATCSLSRRFAAYHQLKSVPPVSSAASSSWVCSLRGGFAKSSRVLFAPSGASSAAALGVSPRASLDRRQECPFDHRQDRPVDRRQDRSLGSPSSGLEVEISLVPLDG